MGEGSPSDPGASGREVFREARVFRGAGRAGEMEDRAPLGLTTRRPELWTLVLCIQHFRPIMFGLC
jgi:hypothetical protein